MTAVELLATAKRSGAVAKEYIGSPRGRKARAALAGAMIAAGPLVFRMPVIRRIPAIRIVEAVGGVALVVALAERIRDWEPSSPA